MQFWTHVREAVECFSQPFIWANKIRKKHNMINNIIKCPSFDPPGAQILSRYISKHSASAFTGHCLALCPFLLMRPPRFDCSKTCLCPIGPPGSKHQKQQRTKEESINMFFKNVPPSPKKTNTPRNTAKRHTQNPILSLYPRHSRHWLLLPAEVLLPPPRQIASPPAATAAATSRIPSDILRARGLR